MTRPWVPGAVTGLGSLPGEDPVEAQRLVFGELPELPHLVELPGRGPHADLVGRAAALLVDLPAEIVPSGWRIASRPGHDLRRAKDLLAWDLDALEQQADGYTGPVKVQLAGPWTLAASLELPSGHRAVSDHGATRDVIASLAEGLRLHLADLAHRIPGANVVLQLDEPSLPAVVSGAVPTPSGYGTVRHIEASVVAQTLGEVLALAPEGARVVHCCAPEVPVELLRRAGADAMALDAALLTRRHNDALGEAVDGGMSLWLGVLPTDEPPDARAARAIIARLWSELGFDPGLLASTVVPTPACGLAGTTPERVRRALTVLRELGRDLLDPGGSGEHDA